MGDVDEVELVTPKMSGLTEFIQESADGDCAEATSKAYEKFKGDMAKITSLKEKADARANKSETEAQKQAGIARRCLAAEQLLSGDAKSRREKLRAHIKKEVSIVEQQYAAKAKQLAQQCSDKIAMARKDEAAKSGSEVDAAVKKKQLQAEEALKKAERTIQRLEEKMKREAVLAKQKLDAVKGQLAAKVKECKSAQQATSIAREQAKKSSQQTAHAQLAAKAAETAERVQVIKLKNKVGRAESKEKAEADTIRNDKVELAKEKALLHEAVSKTKQDESELAKTKQEGQLEKDKAADKE